MSSAGDRLRLAERASWIAGAVVAAGGALVLLGWAAGLSALTTPLAGGASMKPNTALCLVFAGVSLALGNEPRHRSAVRMLATSVMAIGLLTLSQYALGYDVGIDELLFRDLTAGEFPAGRMSPTTALCFFGFGLALLAEGASRGIWLAERLALLVALISGVAVVGYLYDTQALSGVGGYTTMAVHTSFLILLLAVGLLLSRSLRWLAVMVSDSFGGTVARRLLPIAILVPVLLGWLGLRGERAGWYGAEFGMALVVISTIVVFAVVIWSNAKSLIAMEGREREAQDSRSDRSRFRELPDTPPAATPRSE